MSIYSKPAVTASNPQYTKLLYKENINGAKENENAQACRAGISVTLCALYALAPAG